MANPTEKRCKVYQCEGCGVDAEKAIGEYSGMEPFYCVECQWDDEHDTRDENCKCYQGI